MFDFGERGDDHLVLDPSSGEIAASGDGD